MAEPLKNSYGPDRAERVGEMIAAVHPEFDRERFLDAALEGWDALELTERGRRIASALAATLPANRARAIEILIDSLGPPIPSSELTGMDSFLYMPHGYFVAEHGLDCFEVSMRALREITRRFTSEFAIRPFLERHPERTLERLRVWAGDPDVHVRRLVSEGTRPRLPWAPRLREFQRDPAPVLELLELLKDDPEEYVRRSVANNLNDISKDHPGRVVEVADRWWRGGSRDRRRLVRHALRTRIKKADSAALAVLGYEASSPVRVGEVCCTPERPSIGGRVRIEAEIHNPAEEPGGALVDLRVHFVKASGERSPRVFKGAELDLGPGERRRVRKTISLAQHSTRTHYPGEHLVEVLLNGVSLPGASFVLDPASEP